MKKIELELDIETYDKIEELSRTNHCQISDLIKAMIEQLTQPEVMNDSSIGKWAKDAPLVDRIIDDKNYDRTQFIKKSLTERRQLMEKQAEAMEKYYEEDQSWREWVNLDLGQIYEY